MQMAAKQLQEVVWSEEWTTDITSLDHEHKLIAQELEIFRISVDAKSSAENLLELFSSLMALIAEHFKHEEKIMANIGDASAKDHTDKHINIMDQMSALKAAFKTNPSDDNARNALNYLNVAVVHHVCAEDSKIREHMNRD